MYRVWRVFPTHQRNMRVVTGNMMRIMTYVLAITGGALLFTHNAYADIDYLCLKSCKDEGSTTQQCMDNCRIVHDKPSTIGKEALTAGSAQLKEFSTPQTPTMLHLDQGIQLKAFEVKTDYTCLNSCIQERLQYQFCKKKCSFLSDSRIQN